MPTPLSEQSALDELGRAAGPAWIIDPAAARVLAGNAAGAGVFGPSGALDAAMPALARLRDIARGVEPILVSARPLVFWTLAGPCVLDCVIRSVQRPGGGVALLVKAARWPPPGARKAHVAGPEACPEGGPMDWQVDRDPPPMDDAATLREIAHRIREGETALAAASGDAAVTPASAHAAVAIVIDADDPVAPLPPEPAAVVPAAEAPAEVRAGPVSLQPDRLLPGSVPPESLSPETIATLAHELKTPLSAIAAASEVMKDERLGAIGNERYRGYAADIHSGAQHALQLIERLLTRGGEAAAAEPGPAMSFAALDINAIAESCLSSMQPLADKAGLRLSGDLAPGLPPLTADATSLRQILLNLLANAVKFARPGDAVRVVTRRDGAGAIVLEVRDTGPGMSRAEIARAMNSLGGSGRAPRPGGGLGMGLPLVRSLVEANAGRLGIDSAPGKGTAVAVTFPRNRLIAI